MSKAHICFPKIENNGRNDSCERSYEKQRDVLFADKRHMPMKCGTSALFIEAVSKEREW